jgi:hypothetical protein
MPLLACPGLVKSLATKRMDLEEEDGEDEDGRRLHVCRSMVYPVQQFRLPRCFAAASGCCLSLT